MKQAIYEHLYDLENTNIAIHYYTNRGSYFPAHWHPAIELIYILNGTAEILVGGVKHTLVPGEFIVIDSNQIHESQCALASMVVDVHVSRDFLESYIEEPVLPGIDCIFDADLINVSSDDWHGLYLSALEECCIPFREEYIFLIPPPMKEA